MARWEIKNVGMKGVAMAVPENVVKLPNWDFFPKRKLMYLTIQSV